MFGFENADWKPWTTFDGTPVLVPGGFNTEPEPNGDILMYPEGDTSVPPSGRMPKGGLLLRHHRAARSRSTTSTCSVEDNLEEFGPVSDADLEHFAREAERLRPDGDRAILANFGGTAFGDIALVPAPWLKHPKGIRDVAEWYMSTVARFDYVYEVFRAAVRDRPGEPGEDLRGGGRPRVGACSSPAPISARRAGRSSARPATASSSSRSTAA